MKFPNIAQTLLAAASTRWRNNVTPDDALTLEITLKPCISHAENSTLPYLDVQASLKPLSSSKDLLSQQPVLSQLVVLGSIPIHRYTSEELAAYDDTGLLDFTVTDTEEGWRNFHPTREIDGLLRYQFRASPRTVTKSTKPGPRQELRYEPEGFNGGFMALGPLPAVLPDGDAAINIKLTWDLTDRPHGDTGTWSFGDGAVSEYSGTVFELWQSFFAVGALQVKESTSHRGLTANFFSAPPFDVQDFLDRTDAVYEPMREFFRDSSGVYKIFLRKNTNDVYGGSGGAQCFIIEYGDNTNLTPAELAQGNSHELIHNWALVKDRTKSNLALNEQYSGWYVEGIAVYYRMMFMYRWGFLRREDFLVQLNELAISYYTSPAVSFSYDECFRLQYRDYYALMMIYHRGAMHFLDVAGLIVDASQGKTALDDVVVTLAERRRDHLTCYEEDYLDLLTSILGKSMTYAVYNAMLGGHIIVPDSPTTPLKGTLQPTSFQLRRHDQERFELGFDRNSLYEGTISGVVNGSRAARAGVEDGAEVLSWSFGNSVENVNDTFTVVLRKPSGSTLVGAEGRSASVLESVNGDGVEIVYLPRAEGELVECWEWYDSKY